MCPGRRLPPRGRAQGCEGNEQPAVPVSGKAQLSQQAITAWWGLQHRASHMTLSRGATRPSRCRLGKGTHLSMPGEASSHSPCTPSHPDPWPLLPQPSPVLFNGAQRGSRWTKAQTSPASRGPHSPAPGSRTCGEPHTLCRRPISHCLHRPPSHPHRLMLSVQDSA